VNTGVTARAASARPELVRAHQKVTSNTRNRHDTADRHRRATMRTAISDPNVNMVPLKRENHQVGRQGVEP
jgi:hypothetical protein